MNTLNSRILILAVVVLAFAGCGHEDGVDPLLRSRVDGLNKEAFVNRYRDPELCVERSEAALQYISDSLPGYTDGALRALNNLAFAHYQLSQTDAARSALAKLGALEGGENADIEHVIAQLLEARLLQRDCRMADSYRLLYSIEHSGVLEHNQGSLLYNFAQTEYYITLLTLNFHYRNGREADVRQLIDEVEKRRDGLRVDYAQDMALNYAIAYGYQTAGESLAALDYCDRNFAILDLGDVAWCPFHMANTLQMEAYALRSLPGAVQPDSVLDLYLEACDRFWDYGDPYQMIGGVTSSARYALLIGDTLEAQTLLHEWLDSGTKWKPFSAPKMELSLFDLLIRSRASKNPAELRRWYECYVELRDYITRNEKEDFILQTSLRNANRRSRWLTVFAISLSIMLVALAVSAFLLWRTARRLKREKVLLEEAKRHDVERIANVETCLSVLRHDVNPFVSYLRNPDLPADLRSEVLEQLLRTFDNIKSWTRLSVPKGLVFNASIFPLQELFEEVSLQLVPAPTGVMVNVEPTGLSVNADRLLLVILIRNLMNNALQHTAAGSVTLSAAAVEGMVDITVMDTGDGMTAEQVENLFRADRPLPEGDGHGFGLILCRYIIKRHDDNTRRGCRLYAESTPGQGTTMHCVVAGC